MPRRMTKPERIAVRLFAAALIVALVTPATLYFVARRTKLESAQPVRFYLTPAPNAARVELPRPNAELIPLASPRKVDWRTLKAPKELEETAPQE
jgi:hypothetical protein